MLNWCIINSGKDNIMQKPKFLERGFFVNT